MSSTMIVVAGPPGSGKSTAFPVSSFGVAFFNADDRAATLNGESYTASLGAREITEPTSASPAGIIVAQRSLCE